MKTTNYQISKQLAEAGFEAECAYLWFEKDQAIKIGDRIHPINKIEKINKEAISYLPENNKSYPAYDLETILEALPRRIELRKMGKDGVIYELHACFQRSYSEGFKESNYFGYQNFQGFHQELCFMQQENESLADTAAKLWLKLKKEGLV